MYIERADFELEPPKKYKRLSPGEMVRLRYAFIIRCDEVVFDDNGDVEQLNCSYFEDSRSGQDTSGLKPKGVIHWVDAEAGVPVQVRDYQRLFKMPNPGSDTLLADINPDSVVHLNAVVEPAIMQHDSPRFQFERQGYFCKDAALPDVLQQNRQFVEGFKPHERQPSIRHGHGSQSSGWFVNEDALLSTEQNCISAACT